MLNKPEPKFMSGAARWTLVILVTSVLSLFYYVSSGEGYVVEGTSGLSATHVLGKAARKALNGGVAGFLAGLAQVLLFMWMRTVMNYQYAHGGSAANAFRQLYADGGFPRFYQGLTFAIVQAPLARFGDVAFNTAVLAIFDEWAPGVPAFLATMVAAAFGASWRIFISPVDTLKTALQVNGREALATLMARVREAGFAELYAGALANFGANWLGNYPWFATYNTLQGSVPQMPGAWRYARNGLIGRAALTPGCQVVMLVMWRSTIGRACVSATRSYRSSLPLTLTLKRRQDTFPYWLSSMISSRVYDCAK